MGTFAFRNIDQFRSAWDKSTIVKFLKIHAKGHPGHEMPENIAMVTKFLILFNLPKTVIEA